MMPLATGEASLHHVRLFHASSPNRSNDRRIGFAIRYIPTYVHQIVGEKDSAMLVRGADEHGYFEPEIPPKTDFGKDEIAQHEAITNRQAAVLYRNTDTKSFRA
jgi:ectoine hydroxylase-related dioxygenase (phytanoyl-CoA dioxygenase family)